MGGCNLIARCVRVTNACVNGSGVQPNVIFVISLMEIVWLFGAVLDHHHFKSLALQIDFLKINIRVDSPGKAGIGQGVHDVRLSPVVDRL